MTDVPRCDKAGTIGLEDYLEYVQKAVDPRDDDSILESAPKLVALANNREFLAAFLAKGLAEWELFQRDQTTPTSLILGRGAHFMVQANAWAPEALLEPVDRAAYLYDHADSRVAHDHSFSFLTVGYSGRGYETERYIFEEECRAGEIGETRPMQPLGRSRLGTGDVMFYRANRDVHMQFAPEEYSISLNLRLTPEAFRQNHLVDVTRQTIVGTTDESSGGVPLLCDLASRLLGASSAGHLETIAREHGNARVRAAALSALPSVRLRA